MKGFSSILILIIALFFIMASPQWLSDGMFMDGLWYATIARNLSIDLGSFWLLKFTDSVYPQFYEHPPLAFGLQSVLFAIFGDSIYVERVYSILTILISAWVITKIWRLIDNRKTEWIPLLLMISIPLVSWAAVNNLLENTMMVFVLLSVYWQLKSVKSEWSVVYAHLAGMALVGAFLSKGFTGLFPLSFFFWYCIVMDRESLGKSIILFLVVLDGMLITMVALYILKPEAFQFLSVYFEKQVVGSVSSIQTVSTRFYIIGKMLLELLPAMIITLIVYIANGRKGVKMNTWFIFFLLLGLSGVLPIMISLKQRGFYILTAFPFLIIAFSILFRDAYSIIGDRVIGHGWIRKATYFAVFIAVASNAYYLFKVGRDVDNLKDVHLIGGVVPQHTVIKVSGAVTTDWSLHGYLYRHYFISLEGRKGEPTSEYLLVAKGANYEWLKGFNLVLKDMKLYDLYKKKPSHY